MNQPSLDFMDRRIHASTRLQFMMLYALFSHALYLSRMSRLSSLSRIHLDYGPGDLVSRSIKQDDLLYPLSRVSDLRRQYRN